MATVERRPAEERRLAHAPARRDGPRRWPPPFGLVRYDHRPALARARWRRLLRMRRHRAAADPLRESRRRLTILRAPANNLRRSSRATIVACQVETAPRSGTRESSDGVSASCLGILTNSATRHGISAIRAT